MVALHVLTFPCGAEVTLHSGAINYFNVDFFCFFITLVIIILLWLNVY